jgi:hypothetical protein
MRLQLRSQNPGRRMNFLQSIKGLQLSQKSFLRNLLQASRRAQFLL